MYFFYFYPLGLDRPLRDVPVLTRALIVLMVVAFLWTRYWPRLLPISPWHLVFIPGNEAPWTVVTAMFLHGGWLHLLGNLLYFQVFGPPLESRLGAVRFLVYLLMMGVAGNLAHGVTRHDGLAGPGGHGRAGRHRVPSPACWPSPWCASTTPGCRWPGGCSHRWAARTGPGAVEIPVVAAVAAWLLLQVVQALVATETGSSTSFGAHFGGFFWASSWA